MKIIIDNIEYTINLDKTLIDSFEEADNLMSEGKIMEVVKIYREIIPLATQGFVQSVLKAGLIKDDEVDTLSDFFLLYNKDKGQDFLKNFMTGDSEFDDIRNKFFEEYAEYRKKPIR